MQIVSYENMSSLQGLWYFITSGTQPLLSSVRSLETKEVPFEPHDTREGSPLPSCILTLFHF